MKGINYLVFIVIDFLLMRNQQMSGEKGGAIIRPLKI